MPRAPKKTDPAPSGAMDFAHRLRDGVMNDTEFTPDTMPRSRGMGLRGENIEWQATDSEGRRYTVLVFQSG